MPATEEYESEFSLNSVFLVPNIRFDLTHRFKDLEGADKPILNPKCAGLSIGLAEQRIEFRLDRSGAEVSSQAKVLVKPEPRYFICDRPFLVYMKARDQKTPFLVLWIENAELLSKW